MGTQVAVAGARPNQISYLLDGTDVNTQGNQSPGSAAGGMLGVETVREFQILVNSYSAEYGRSAGGIVSAVTRSGTNTLHGAAFEFHRNDSLDAKPISMTLPSPSPPSRATSTAARWADRFNGTACSSLAVTRASAGPHRNADRARAQPGDARADRHPPDDYSRTWRSIPCPTARRPARRASTPIS